MASLRSIIVGACVLAAGLGLHFLIPAVLEAAPHTRPRAKVHEMVVPPPPPPPATRKSLVLGSRKKSQRSAAPQPQAAERSDSPATSYAITTAAYRQTVATSGAGSNSDVSAPDPEAIRIQNELRHIRDNADARRAFYDDLRRTVERVRSGELHESSRKSGPTGIEPRRPSAQPAQAQDPDGKTFSVRPATHPEDIQPAEPDEPEAPQAQWSPSSGSIDRTAYQRVVRWAKANGTPVQLALAVAWMESHLNENAPRGGSGEVGMFQIMPARCVTEGWAARRLSEPEFNAWMGTMLLTRYYQEEGSVARAAAKYVAGPGVFNKTYSKDVWDYINWYASTVESYANYFSRFHT